MGLFNDLWQAINPIPAIKENIFDTLVRIPDVGVDNLRAMWSAGYANATGTANPGAPDAGFINVASVLGGTNMYVARKDIVVKNKFDNQVEDPNNPGVMVAPSFTVAAGTVVVPYTGSLKRSVAGPFGVFYSHADELNLGAVNGRPDPYAAGVTGGDVNGDGFTGDKIFVGEDGNDYVALAPSNMVYDQLRNTVAGSSSSMNLLPSTINNSYTGDVAMPISEGGSFAKKWLRIQKDYRNYDAINSRGIHPIYGAGPNTGVFGTIYNNYGYNSLYGGYYTQAGFNYYNPTSAASQYNRDNPYQKINDMKNVANSYNTKPIITTVEVVSDPTKVTNGNKLLYEWLPSLPIGQRQYLNLQGYKYTLPDGTEKNITAAYMNDQNQLLVEYA